MIWVPEKSRTQGDYAVKHLRLVTRQCEPLGVLYLQYWNSPKSCQRCSIQREVRSLPARGFVLRLSALGSGTACVPPPFWMVLGLWFCQVLVVAADSLLGVRRSSNCCFLDVFSCLCVACSLW